MCQRDAEIAWAAGIIEGEGCINHKRSNGRDAGSGLWRLQVVMADRDIMDRLVSVLGGRVISRSGDINPLLSWTIARQEDLLNVLSLIRPWLGSRRGLKADECVADLVR